jgi:hypothetical protein
MNLFVCDDVRCFPQTALPFCVQHLVNKVVIPVTGRGVLHACGTSKLPHFPETRLTHAGEVVSLTHRPSFTFKEDSWY